MEPEMHYTVEPIDTGTFTQKEGLEEGFFILL